jgi:hypothetical protein
MTALRSGKLENVLQGELNNAWRYGRARDDSEGARCAAIEARIVELGVIRQVEELGAKLQVGVLAQAADAEFAADTGIEVELARSAENISSGVAKARAIADHGSGGEGGSVEVRGQAGLRAAALHGVCGGHPGCKLRVGGDAVDRSVRAVGDGEGQAGLDGRYTGQRPVIYHALQEQAAGREFGNVVRIAHHKAMSAVEAGSPASAPRVVEIAGKAAEGLIPPACRDTIVVDRVAPRIAGDEGQSIREAAGDTELQAVILAIQDRLVL